MSGTRATEIEVIDAFLRVCPDGDPATVGEWCRMHPEHADAILEAAATIILAPPPEMRAVADETTRLARRKAAIERAGAILAAEGPAQSLRELIVSAGTDLPMVANTLGIDREPLAEVEAGHVTLPLPQRLVAALAGVLRVTASVVEAAIRHAHDTPRLGHAASEGEPTVGRATWRELVEDSDMSPERKAYWLAED